MSNTRRKFSPEFKFKVVLEALKERETLAQLAVRFEVHQTMISNWKKEFVKNPEKFFEKDHSGKSSENADATSLYAKIGQLEMENDFKKKLAKNRTLKERKEMVERNHQLSIRRQCKLLSIHLSSMYYKPVGESELNLDIMKEIDKHHLDEPTHGVLRTQDHLRDIGYSVGESKVRRLMRLMGIQCLYPGPNLSKLGKAKYIHPYLLKNLSVIRPNQVWAIDITYIPMQKGFLYLTAIIDIYSRFVVGWKVSNSLAGENCIEVLREALNRYGKPEIINSDQGAQFTCEAWVEELQNREIQISMDGKGRARDNAFIERLWRSVKYDFVYLRPPKDGYALADGLKAYFEKYNFKMSHQGINRMKPSNLYFTPSAA